MTRKTITKRALGADCGQNNIFGFSFLRKRFNKYRYVFQVKTNIFDIYFCFSLKHQSLVEEVRYFLYSSFNGVSYAIKNLPNGLEKSVVMIYNYPFRPTWTDSLISSTTIFPELSMSNILKAQLTSS